MAYVPVPKDMNAVKTKVAFNLTKRQIVCFGSGLLNHCLRGNLCCPCAEHGRGERYLHGNLDGYGLHRAAVLHAV